ncbi:MAG: DoxX family protein [Acidimicrobiia bacterium]|nr:DoxX family protein [Acidimicrobiia bacterium]
MTEMDLALMVLRAWIGVVMLAHGVKHLRGREKTTNWLASIGYKNPGLNWFAMTATEIGVGGLLIAGLLTTLAAAGTAAIMVVAYLTVHRTVGFWVTARPDEGWEYVATILVSAIVVGLLGPGGLSLDNAIGIGDDLDGWAGLAIVAGGVLAGVGQVAAMFRPQSS